MIEVGDNFPSFSLLDHSGNNTTSGDLKGKKFVVFSYPRAMTPGCTAEACSMRDYYKELTDKGFQAFGLSNDGVDKNAKFAKKYDLPYPLLCDVDNKLLTDLNAYGEKTSYGKTKMGVFRKTWVVDEKFKIRKIFKKVNTKIHAEEVLQIIKELDL